MPLLMMLRPLQCQTPLKLMRLQTLTTLLTLLITNSALLLPQLTWALLPLL